MEVIKKYIGVIILALLVIATIGMVWQGRTIQRLKADAEDNGTAALIETERRYTDSLRIRDERIKSWEVKYDSLSSYKKITNTAIKINKKKSDEKVHHIFTANDSVLKHISDSTLRANGFDR